MSVSYGVPSVMEIVIVTPVGMLGPGGATTAGAAAEPPAVKGVNTTGTPGATGPDNGVVQATVVAFLATHV
jgi:hypothetical protein